jgi:hypothetical protein
MPSNVRVDFNTGFRLLKAEQVDIDIKYLKCETVTNFQGQVECKGYRPEVQRFEVWRLSVKDDEGKEVTLWYKQEPKKDDELCAIHLPQRAQIWEELNKPQEETPKEPPAPAAPNRGWGGVSAPEGSPAWGRARLGETHEVAGTLSSSSSWSASCSRPGEVLNGCEEEWHAATRIFGCAPILTALRGMQFWTLGSPPAPSAASGGPTPSARGPTPRPPRSPSRLVPGPPGKDPAGSRDLRTGAKGLG